MLSHVHVGVSDFPRSYAFYSALFEVLGLELRFHQPERFWAGWGRWSHRKAAVLHRVAIRSTACSLGQRAYDRFPRNDTRRR